MTKEGDYSIDELKEFRDKKKNELENLEDTYDEEDRDAAKLVLEAEIEGINILIEYLDDNMDRLEQ